MVISSECGSCVIFCNYVTIAFLAYFMYIARLTQGALGQPAHTLEPVYWRSVTRNGAALTSAASSVALLGPSVCLGLVALLRALRALSDRATQREAHFRHMLWRLPHLWTACFSPQHPLYAALRGLRMAGTLRPPTRTHQPNPSHTRPPG